MVPVSGTIPSVIQATAFRSTATAPWSIPLGGHPPEQVVRLIPEKPQKPRQQVLEEVVDHMVLEIHMMVMMVVGLSFILIFHLEEFFQIYLLIL